MIYYKSEISELGSRDATYVERISVVAETPSARHLLCLSDRTAA